MHNVAGRRVMRARFIASLMVCLIGAPALATGAGAADGDGRLAQGAYLFAAGGCANCHSVAGKPPLSGGPALKTPFGTFYGPNITPDPEHGLGSWREADFVAAMRAGRMPDGGHYFPAFPYTSFTFMTDSDLGAVWAYMRTLPPAPTPRRAHDLDPPFGWRFLMAAWKWLNFESGPFSPDPAHSAEERRGAYLVAAVGHCGECHTPRNVIGGLRRGRWLGGNPAGPDGEKVPNITPAKKTRIGEWSVDDIASYLELGIDPDGDVVGGPMEEVVRNATSRLTGADRRAIAIYLKSLTPVED